MTESPLEYKHACGHDLVDIVASASSLKTLAGSLDSMERRGVQPARSNLHNCGEGRMMTRSFYSGKNWTSSIFAKLPPDLPQMTESNTNTLVDMTWLTL